MWGEALVYRAAGTMVLRWPSRVVVFEPKPVPLIVPSLLITCMEGCEGNERILKHPGQNNVYKATSHLRYSKSIQRLFSSY